MSTGSQYPKNLDQHSEIGGKDIPRNGVVSSPEVEWLETSISNLGPREPLGQQLWKCIIHWFSWLNLAGVSANPCANFQLFMRSGSRAYLS